MKDFIKIFSPKIKAEEPKPNVEAICFGKEFCTNILIDTIEYEVFEINIDINSYVFAKDTLIKLKSWMSSINEVSIPFNGFVHSVSVSVGQKVKLGTLLFNVQKAESIEDFSTLAFEYNKKKLHDTSISLIIDDFTKEKSFVFTRIAGQDSNFIDTYSENKLPYFLGLTFENNNGFAYLKFLSNSPSFSLAKGDSIILLFEDDTTINYKFQSKATIRKLDGNIYSNIMPITIDALNKFASNLKKIKLTSERKGIFDIYHFQKILPNSLYKSEAEAQYLLKFMVMLFIKQHIDNNIKMPSS